MAYALSAFGELPARTRQGRMPPMLGGLQCRVGEASGASRTVESEV
jgi:hypothetical protein